MRSILVSLMMCFWMGAAFAGSEVQEPIPPVSCKTEDANKSQEQQNPPNKNISPSQSVVVTVYPSEQSKRKEDKGNNQACTNPEPSKWTDPLAIFTLLLVVVTGGLVYVGYRQAQLTRIIERAYVTMTHFPPGLILDKTTGQFRIAMQVKNSGHTPARITGKPLAHKTLPKNSLPPDVARFREESRKNNAALLRLVAQDKFIFPFFGQAEDITNIQNGTKDLWLYRFVDYIDQFGRPDFAFYVRRYEPRLDVQPLGMSNETFAQRSNLVFEN